MRLDVRNTKPLVLIFCSHCISEKIDFWSDEKTCKLALARWFWAFFSNLRPNTQKNVPNRRAKTDFQLFFVKWKTDFLTDTVQTKNRDKQFRIPYIEAHPTHSSERKKPQLLNQCQKTMKTAYSGKLLSLDLSEISKRLELLVSICIRLTKMILSLKIL